MPLFIYRSFSGHFYIGKLKWYNLLIGFWIVLHSSPCLYNNLMFLCNAVTSWMKKDDVSVKNSLFNYSFFPPLSAPDSSNSFVFMLPFLENFELPSGNLHWTLAVFDWKFIQFRYLVACAGTDLFFGWDLP